MFRKKRIVSLLVYASVVILLQVLPVEELYSNIHNKSVLFKQSVRASGIEAINIAQDAQIFRSESNLNNCGQMLETEQAYYIVNDALLLEKMNKDYELDPAFQVRSERWGIDNVQVVGDWLFYTSNGIHRINLDGTRDEKLYKGRVMDLYVTPEWIYFVDYKNGSQLFRMTINGEELTCLNDGCFRDLLLDGDRFYATKVMNIEGDVANLVSIDLEGRESLLVENLYAHHLIKEDRTLYYRNSEDGYLWRINLDSLESEIVVLTQMTYFALDENYIYYSVRDEGTDAYDDIGLYRMDRSTQDTIVLDDTTVRSIGVIYLLGDRVFIESDYKEHPFAWIRMQKDGSHPVFMESWDS